MIQLIIDNISTQYMIDEQGNIYNTKTKKFLSGTIRSGYKMVKLTIAEIKKDYGVHRLVANMFIPNPQNLPQVNHKDGNKLNNTVENLEWVTCQQNIQHMNDMGKKQRQIIRSIDEEISETNGWKQFKDTSYWFNIDGRGANIKTKKYLNTVVNANGYHRFYLYINKQRITYSAHRLIYELFSGITLDNSNEQINHIDGNKNNNAFNNLEKVSRSENVLHSCYTLNKKVKPVAQYSLDGVLIKEYQSISQAARELECCDSGISQICKGKGKTYKGYIWKYI